MNRSASVLVDLNTDLKKNRDEMKPLKEQLLNDMQQQNLKQISVGQYCVKLVERRARKPVSTKTVLGIIQTELGDEAASTVRAACELARGEPSVKHSLKICELDDNEPEEESAA